VRQSSDYFRVTAIGVAAAAMLVGHAHALLIVPTFDLNPTK
jgi:hypothetical protein